jgi:hypothetical protein
VLGKPSLLGEDEHIDDTMLIPVRMEYSKRRMWWVRTAAAHHQAGSPVTKAELDVCASSTAVGGAGAVPER